MDRSCTPVLERTLDNNSSTKAAGRLQEQLAICSARQGISSMMLLANRSVSGALIMDRIGRKPLMVLGIGGCLVCLSIYTALVARFASPLPEAPNQAGLRAAVAML